MAETMATISSTPSVKTIAIASLALYIVYRIGAGIQQVIRHRAVIKERGCLPAADADTLPSRRDIVNKYGGVDRFFGLGIGNLAWIASTVRQRIFFPARMALLKEISPSTTYKMHTANVKWTFTQEVENVKYVMLTDFDNWGFVAGREHGLGQFLGKGIFTTIGKEWEHSRALLKPSFTRFQVSNMALFERHFQRLLKEIPRDGSTVNLSPLFFAMMTDSSTEFLFGTSADTQGHKDGATFGDDFVYCQKYGMALLRLGSLGSWVPWSSKFRAARKRVHAFIDGYVDQAMERKRRLGPVKKGADEKGQYVVLDELVEMTSDRVQMRSELLATLLAGRDSTASTLTSIWFTLARHPDVWRKLQAEVASLNGQQPTFEGLKELKYLQAVMHEVLRLWPPVSLNSRVALKDRVLPRGGGPDSQAPLFMPEGSNLAWILYAYHRQKHIWGEDAEEFRPERWLGPDAMRFGWHYTPFNAGPRVCLGQQFATSQLGYVTVRLCQEFEGIELKGKLTEWQENTVMIATHSEGATVSLKPRA